MPLGIKNPFRGFLRRGQDGDSIEERDEKGKPEGSERPDDRDIRQAPSIEQPQLRAVASAQEPVVSKKKSNCLTYAVIALVIVIFCSCSAIFLAALPEQVNTSEMVIQNATQTAVVELITRTAQGRPTASNTGKPASTPTKVVSAAGVGAKVATSVPTPVNRNVSPSPTATATVTPTVGVAAYVPPWQREYNNTLEIFGLLLCLVIPVALCILLTVWLWQQTQPLPAKEVKTKLSFGDLGNITVKWSISARRIAGPLTLLREKFLRKDSIGQLLEYLQTLIQNYGISLEPNKEIRKDLGAFFAEFNELVRSRREGKEYLLGGRAANNSYARNACTFLRQATSRLIEEQERWGVEVVELFIAEDFVAFDSVMQVSFEERRKQKEEDREADAERARQLAEEQRLLEQSHRQAEEALKQMKKDAEEFVVQCNTIVFGAGLKSEDPRADALIKTFTAKREAEIRAQTEERLARFRLDLDREIAQRQAAAREREVEADAQRARAFAQFAEAVNKLASGLENLDLMELVRAAVSVKQAQPAGTEPNSGRGDSGRVNGGNNRGGNR